MTEAPTNLNGLVELGNREGVDIRPTLLRVMTDLYVQKAHHTEQEEQHFTELVLRLIDLVDTKTRAVIADKIAGYPSAPARVRQRVLKEMIAVRPPKPDLQPDNRPASDDKPAAAELSDLFFAGDAVERRLILINLPYAQLPPAKAVAPARTHEAANRLEAAALGHNSELFARELERVLAISRAQARRVYEDHLGEPIVVIAAALGMPSAVLQRILLCLHPSISQSVQRVYELALLHEEIGPEAALRMIAIWQASHPAETKSPVRPATAHQPVHAPDREGRAFRSGELPVSRQKIRWEEYAQTRKAEGA